MELDDYRQIVNVLNQWLILCEENKRLDRYLRKKGYQSIAVYGMGIYGRHLIRNLKKTEIKIVCGIDVSNTESFMDVPVFTPENVNENIDVIINTVMRQQKDIEIYLKELYSVPVVSLEEVVFDSY